MMSETERTKEELDAEWMFNARVSEPCRGCGKEPTRLASVRPIFGTAMCSSCFYERRRRAPAGDVIRERLATDGGEVVGDE